MSEGNLLAEDAIYLAARTGLTARSGDGNWWLEDEGDSLLGAIPEGLAKASVLKSRDNVRQEGEATGERLVSALLAGSSGTEALADALRTERERAEGAWSDATDDVDELRRLLSAWLRLVLGRLHVSGVHARRSEYRQAAESCYWAVMRGRRDVSDDEPDAWQAIGTLVALPQLATLASSVGQRARVLAERVQSRYDVAVYVDGVVRVIESRGFARLAALPITVYAEPVEAPEPIDVIKPLITAMLSDAEDASMRKKGYTPGVSHRAEFGRLSKEETLAAVRGLTNVDDLCQIVHWLHEEIKVKGKSGNMAKISWDQISDLLEEISSLFKVPLVRNRGGIASAYGDWKNGKEQD